MCTYIYIYIYTLVAKRGVRESQMGGAGVGGRSSNGAAGGAGRTSGCRTRVSRERVAGEVRDREWTPLAEV